MNRAQPERLSLTSARRLAIAAQGLATPLPPGRVDARHFRSAMERLGLLQIDAVNVLARSHLLVLRARFGATHDTTLQLLERAAYTPARRSRSRQNQQDPAAQPEQRRVTEYWGHEASFVRTEDWPLYRWRMQRGERGEMWSGYARFGREEQPRISQAIDWLAAHGPATSGELDEAMGWGPGVRGPWGTRSNAKLALAWLFWTGRIGVAARTGFVRRYDIIERVLPADVLALDVDEREAHSALLLQAARCLGVATADDLIDYHRLPKRIAPARIEELCDSGDLARVAVDRWRQPAFIPADTALARRSSRSVLLSPFDPLVWYRPRAERLFDFHYRIEIYTPKAKRRYGYFVLPFLHNDALVARVDVRLDRSTATLEVPAAWTEPGIWPPDGSQAETDALEALAAELRALAAWCGTSNEAKDGANDRANDVVAGPLGDLADRLKAVCR